MQMTGKTAGYVVAGVGWTLLGTGVGLDHAGLRFGASLATIGGWVIATGLALAVIAASERGFGALDRFFSEILARTRRASPRVEPTFDAVAAPPALLRPTGQGAAPRVLPARGAGEPAPRLLGHDAERQTHHDAERQMRRDAERQAVRSPERQAYRDAERPGDYDAPRPAELALERRADPAAARPAPRPAPRSPVYAAAYADATDDILDTPARAARPTPARAGAVYPLDAPQPAAAAPSRSLTRAAAPAPSPLAAPQPSMSQPSMSQPSMSQPPMSQPSLGPQPALAPFASVRAFEELLDWAALESRAAAEPRPAEPRPVEPRPVEPRPAESRPAEPRPAEPRAAEPSAPAPAAPAAASAPRPSFHPAPAAPANFDPPRAALIEEGEIAGHVYRVLADLTVEIDTLLGVRRFDSMEAARRFVGAPDRLAARARSVA